MCGEILNGTSHLKICKMSYISIIFKTPGLDIFRCVFFQRNSLFMRLFIAIETLKFSNLNDEKQMRLNQKCSKRCKRFANSMSQMVKKDQRNDTHRIYLLDVWERIKFAFRLFAFRLTITARSFRCDFGVCIRFGCSVYQQID